MATRPLFIPLKSGSIGVDERLLEFDWHPGMAVSQKQKSILSLHKTAAAIGFTRVLEISSKSENDAGKRLSAFNLLIKTRKKQRVFSVESAFQASKVFEKGGPFTDLLNADSRDAKKDIRLRESGNLVKFTFFGTNFPLVPRTFFYDWIYINALYRNEDLANEVIRFDAFSDIEFNPKKSINCQAYSAALFVSLQQHGVLVKALESPESFLKILDAEYQKRTSKIAIQSSLI